MRIMIEHRVQKVSATLLYFFDLGLIDKARQNYQEATNLAVPLHFVDPIRLGLVLNFSVFYWEIAGDRENAVKIAKEVGYFLDLIATNF